MTAFFSVENFVGKVAAEQKWFWSAFFYRCPKAVIVSIESNEDSFFTQLFSKIIARFLALFRPAEKVPLKI
jgi:hypothetical protein